MLVVERVTVLDQGFVAETGVATTMGEHGKEEVSDRRGDGILRLKIELACSSLSSSPGCRISFAFAQSSGFSPSH